MIGLPNETISIKDGKVIIKPKNGEEFVLDEKKYLSEDNLREWVYSNNLREEKLGENDTLS